MFLWKGGPYEGRESFPWDNTAEASVPLKLEDGRVVSRESASATKSQHVHSRPSAAILTRPRPLCVRLRYLEAVFVRPNIRGN